MIYIITKYDNYDYSVFIHNLWVVKDEYDVGRMYYEFINQLASDMNIVINEHYYNIMNYVDYHKDKYTRAEYKKKSKEWSKILSTCDIEYFIEHELNGEKVEYKMM